MSVYSTLIDSLNPVRWARCDELLHGVLNDSSTFAKHGTIEPLAVLGQQSAIQTDPSSSSIAGPVGRFPAAAGGEADLKQNFTILWWQFYDAANPSGSAWCRRGQLGLTHSVQGGINNGNIFADITLEGAGAGDYFPLVSPLTLVDQTWYFNAAVRNGNAGLLYVNADVNTLGDSRNDLTGADVDYNVDGTDWFLGRSVNTTAFPSSRLDEVVFLNYALTALQITSVKDAALTALALHAYSNVLPSAVWYSQPNKIPVHFPSIRHNFGDPVLERVSFLTNNSKTVGGSIEGSEMMPKPRREIEINYLARSDEERREHRFKLWANQHKTWFLPIRQDFEQLTSSLSSGVQTIPVSTQYKDYEVNNWVGVRQIDDQGKIVKSEVLKVDAVNPNDVHTITATANSYPPFLSYAYPVRRGILSRSLPVRGHTDSVEETILVFELLPQDEAVVPNRITPWTPTILYKGYEAHDPAVWQSHNWVDGRNYDIDRELARIDFETGIFEVESDNPGAEEAFEYRMLLKGRDKIAQFLGWFYSRGGSLTYLWVPSMQKDFDVLSSTSNDITVSRLNYSENFALAEARRDLAFIYHDNTVALRRVLGFSGSPDETLDLGLSGSPTLLNLKSVSLLKFCQMESDSVELAWVTDDVVQVAWRFKELLSTPV